LRRTQLKNFVIRDSLYSFSKNMTTTITELSKNSPRDVSKNRKIEAKRVRDATEVDNLLWRIRARTDISSQTGSIIGMTSCCRSSGVSTLVANLAIRAAENHMGPVLIVDSNMSNPGQEKLFRQKSQAGTLDVLVGMVAPAEAIQQTSVPDLDLLTLGSKQQLVTAKIVPKMFEELSLWARQHYSTIFIDLPSIHELEHALMFARQADFTLVAIRSGSVRSQDVVESINRLEEDGIKVAGTLLTRRKSFTPSWIRRFL